jgi:hypothetical protein
MQIYKYLVMFLVSREDYIRLLFLMLANFYIEEELYDDPPKLAEGAQDEDETMGHYRRVRNRDEL